MLGSEDRETARGRTASSPVEQPSRPERHLSRTEQQGRVRLGRVRLTRTIRRVHEGASLEQLEEPFVLLLFDC